MGSWFRRQWRKVRGYQAAFWIVVGCVLVAIIIGGYLFKWDWTGLGSYTTPPHTKDSDFQREKTFWDWMQLLFIPIVLAIGGYLFNLAMKRSEREITADNQHEAALQGYIDKMSDLLLKEHLREPGPENEVRTVARVRTLTVLPRLDKERKSSLLQFLYEAGLIEKNQQIIDLKDADFREASLSFANLKDAHLAGANFKKADLRFTNLTGVDFTKADLRGANLTGAVRREVT